MSKALWWGAGLAALFALLLYSVLGQGDIQRAPPALSGRVWTTTGPDGGLLLYVTREERARAVSRIGRISRSFYESYDRYALHVRRVGDGALQTVLPLGDVKVRQELTEPRIVGIVDGTADDVVWLWRDGPEARAVPSLELLFDTAALRAKSPDLAALLPADPKGYRVRTGPVALLTKGRDARVYAIDPASATLTLVAADDLPPSTFTTRAEDRFDYIVSPGQSRITTHPNGILQKSFLTPTGHWYALLSESERAGLSPWPSAEDRPNGEVARSLHRAAYRMEGAHPAIDPAAVEPLGDVRIVQAGFLVRSDRAVWDVPEPSSTLVLGKPLLGATEPWEVVRLARDGSVVWRTSTELADIGEVLDAGTHVLFVGQRAPSGVGSGAASAPEDSDVRERIVWIDERTGARETVFVATGEMAVPEAR